MTIQNAADKQKIDIYKIINDSVLPFSDEVIQTMNEI